MPSWKKLTTLLCATLGCGLLGLTFYVAYLIKSSRVDAIMQSKTFKTATKLKERVVFEEGGVANRADFRHFFPFFSHDTNFKRWHQLALKERQIDPSGGGEIVFTQNLELEVDTTNDCEKVYCYQRRMPFSDIPITFLKGLIGIEDYRFLSHKGVDLKSILRALIADIKAMKIVQGGSTLTQQLLKNLLFSKEKKFSRKLKEVILSVYVEKNYSKEEIIAAYLNEVYWGSLQSMNFKGLFAASLFYFQKRPQDLSDYEVSILISLLKGPNYYHPIKYTERLKQRVSVVYKKLVNLKLSAKVEGGKWDDNKWKKWVAQLKKNNEQRVFRAVWQGLSLKSSLFNPYERYAFVRGIQKTKKVLAKQIEDRDIAIKAVFGRPFCRDNCPFFTYYSKIERSLAKGIESERHQVGSILKPLIYTQIIKEGLSLDEEVSTAPIELDLISGRWSPKEASDTDEVKNITVKQALLKSKNRPLIRLANELGFDYLEEKLRPFLPTLKSPLREYPAQLIGALEMSLMEVFDSYTSFIRDQCANGQAEGEAGDENLLTLLSDPTQNTLGRVVSKRFKHLNFFGKTGTSNKGLDNWFVSFDGDELGIIWLGLEGDRQGKTIQIGGASSSFRIFQYFQEGRGKRFSDLYCPESADLSGEGTPLKQ